MFIINIIIENHVYFVSEDTIKKLAEIIITGNEIILPHALCFVNTILEKGNVATVELLKTTIKVDHIRLQLVSQKNDYLLRTILA